MQVHVFKTFWMDWRAYFRNLETVQNRPNAAVLVPVLDKSRKSLLTFAISVHRTNGMYIPSRTTPIANVPLSTKPFPFSATCSLQYLKDDYCAARESSRINRQHKNSRMSWHAPTCTMRSSAMLQEGNRSVEHGRPAAPKRKPRATADVMSRTVENIGNQWQLGVTEKGPKTLRHRE